MIRSFQTRLARRLRAGLSICFFLAVFSGLNAVAWADPNVAPLETDAQLTQMRERLETIRKGLDNQPDDDALAQWSSDLQQLQSKADALAETLTPRLADVAARLNQLGAAPADANEPHDVAEQRAQLVKASSSVNSQLKLAKLLSVEAAQLGDRLATERRTQFQAQLGERHRTFFSSTFRNELVHDLRGDLTRFGELGGELADSAGQTPGIVWLLIIAGIVAVLAARYGIRRLLMHVASTRVPSGRLRRSVFAAALVLLAVATPGLIAQLLDIGLTWSGTLSDVSETLISAMVGILCLAGYISGLSRALMSPKRASWRLLPLSDKVAMGLRWLPNTLAVLAVVAWLAKQLPTALDIGLNTTIAMTSVATIALGLTLAWALIHGEQLRRQSQRDPETGQAPSRPLWIAVVSTLAWLALILGVVCVLIGYASLGAFIITQGFWLLIVTASAYLLSVLINDVLMTFLAGKKPEHHTPQSRLRYQAAVLLSGVGRAIVALIAIVLLLNPFGGGPTEVVHSVDQLRKGLKVGEVTIQPDALWQAVLVLLLGLFCVRVLKRWLKETYLPATTMDPGMRSSTSTLFGYTGIIFVVALTLSALGLGLERVAWIASALSVGIGFGLQAVVQNFVSGLILLAERPVKVGDWVSLGGVEGDIQRINVRATEILMLDKSTVIVPNSEFITKTVRNVTHARSIGRVQIKLPMPLETDPAKVRELIMAVFAEQAEIVAAPAATVYLDGIESDRLMFNALAYVESPRLAYVVRSRVWYEVLARIALAGMQISASSTVVLQQGGSSVKPPPPSP